MEFLSFSVSNWASNWFFSRVKLLTCSSSWIVFDCNLRYMSLLEVSLSLIACSWAWVSPEIDKLIQLLCRWLVSECCRDSICRSKGLVDVVKALEKKYELASKLFKLLFIHEIYRTVSGINKNTWDSSSLLASASCSRCIRRDSSLLFWSLSL